MSAMMTTMMIGMPQVIERIRTENPDAKIRIGGAPIDEDLVAKWGNDATGSDARNALEESALGLVRATDERPGNWDLILEIQTDLCWMMSELSVVDEENRPESHITADRVAALDEAYAELVASHPRIAAELEKTEVRAASFAHRGQSAVGASMHLARSSIRRAERPQQLFADRGQIHNPNILPYVSRLLPLMYAMARAEEHEARSGGEPGS
jgi:cob(I)alamin adenosyltransferase